MTGFSAHWLKQRRPFDAAARDGGLARRFGAALGAAVVGERGAPRRIIDLAAGSGANFTALAPLIGGDQEWLLLENDPSLLAALGGELADWSAREGRRCRESDRGTLIESESGQWRARTQRLDLAHSLEEIDFSACDGITTSAFLDLVSAAWLDRLCLSLKRHPRPFLAMLTVDGRREWQPALPGDAPVLAAFARHQGRDKGFGPALGGLAVNYLSDRLPAQGYTVSTARSDWRVGATDREMLLKMVEESAAVAREAEPAASALFTGWSEERKAQIGNDLLTLTVGHLDLLALPRIRP